MTDPVTEPLACGNAMPRDTFDVPDVAQWAEAGATLFASPAWFACWMAAFGREGRHGTWPSAPARFAVPYVVVTRAVAGVPVRIVVGAANSYTPQYDIVGPGTPTVPELRRMLADLDGDALELPFLAPQSSAMRALAGCSGVEVAATEAAPVVDTHGTWAAYLATRSKSRRREWHDKERALAASGATFAVFERWEAIAPRFGELLDLEASGWKGRKGTAMRQRPNALRFFELLCPPLAHAGKLRLLAVLRDERLLAFKLCTLHGGRLSSLKTGFDEGLQKASPGQVLNLWTLRWCFERSDVALFDFLAPSTPHKLAWATRCEQLSSIRLWRATPRGALAWLRWSAGPRVKAMLGAGQPAAARPDGA